MFSSNLKWGNNITGKLYKKKSVTPKNSYYDTIIILSYVI
jgi:hypothetical protein